MVACSPVFLWATPDDIGRQFTIVLLQHHIEPPQLVQMLEHLVTGVTQRDPVVRHVAQRQRAIAFTATLNTWMLGSRLLRLYWADKVLRTWR